MSCPVCGRKQQPYGTNTLTCPAGHHVLKSEPKRTVLPAWVVAASVPVVMSAGFAAHYLI